MPKLAEALVKAGCKKAAILNALQLPIEPARICCLIEILLGMERGELVKSVFRAASWRVRETFMFSLHIPTSKGKRSTRPIELALNEALAEKNLGEAYVSGAAGEKGADGEFVFTEDHFTVTILDDRAEGIRIIREVLKRLDAPRSTKLIAYVNNERIPLT